MDLILLKDFLFWCWVINFGILLYWFLMLIVARDWVYRFHGRWFKDLSTEKLDSIHYASMAGFKLMVFVFNFVPWLALTIMA